MPEFAWPKANGDALALLAAENAAAISDGVHSNKEGYARFYEAFANDLSGFPGIWKYCAECGLELERQRPNADNPEGWIEAVLEVQAVILRSADGSKCLSAKVVVEKAMRRLKIKEKHEQARKHR